MADDGIVKLGHRETIPQSSFETQGPNATLRKNKFDYPVFFKSSHSFLKLPSHSFFLLVIFLTTFILWFRLYRLNPHFVHALVSKSHKFSNELNQNRFILNKRNHSSPSNPISETNVQSISKSIASPGSKLISKSKSQIIFKSMSKSKTKTKSKSKIIFKSTSKPKFKTESITEPITESITESKTKSKTKTKTKIQIIYKPVPRPIPKPIPKPKHPLNLKNHFVDPSHPKIAFLFLTRGPLPLASIWIRFFSDYSQYYSIYVHANPNFTVESDESIPKLFRNAYIPSKEVTWGDISLVDAETRLLRSALTDPNNQRFILLSESCVPLFNFAFVYNFLLSTNLSFIESSDSPEPQARGRYNTNFEPEVTIDQWRKGSQWFQITRKHARMVVNDKVYYNKFKNYCIAPCYSDEHYFPSMLSILDGGMLTNQTLTWSDWSWGGYHPRSFGDSDIDRELLRQMRGIPNCSWFGTDQKEERCYMFARKIEPMALATFLELSLAYLGF